MGPKRASVQVISQYRLQTLEAAEAFGRWLWSCGRVGGQDERQAGTGHLVARNLQMIASAAGAHTPRSTATASTGRVACESRSCMLVVGRSLNEGCLPAAL